LESVVECRLRIRMESVRPDHDDRVGALCAHLLLAVGTER
jgi:hypothetical protein